MSIAAQVAQLEQQIPSLEEEKKQAQNSYNSINKELSLLIQKQRSLEERFSPLAKELLASINTQISEVQNKLTDAQNRLSQAKNQLQQCRNKINTLKEDPKEYISEQIPEMVKKIMEHIKTNSHEIGLNFQATFHLRAQTHSNNGEMYVPDGILYVYEVFGLKIGSTICSTTDFYFDKELYSLDYYREAIKSEWFQNFLQLFWDSFKISFKKEFDNNKFLSQNFNLTFDKNSFKLELV